MVHAKQHGTVVVWEKQAAGNIWHKIDKTQTPTEIQTLLNGLSGHHDTYFTVNEFYGWRITRLLKSLRANYVDLDLGFQPDHSDLDLIYDTLQDARLPWPSLVVFSGRGMHLYWCTEPTPAQALPVWQAMQKVLIAALKDVGADIKARDCSRVLRLLGTINSKNNEEVRGCVLDSKPWKFHDLANEILGHREPKKKAVVRSIHATAIRAGNHPRATTFRRWHLVFQDLAKIGGHYGSIPEGFRNEFLFLSSVALSWFAAPESIEDEVVDFARLYCSDLDVDEARMAAAQSVDRAGQAAKGVKVAFHGEEKDPRYFFKRQTLWERLGAIAEPIRGKLRAIIPDEQAAENKRERDAARWEDHYTGNGVRVGNEGKRATARLMAAQGATQTAIATELGVSQKTISVWLK